MTCRELSGAFSLMLGLIVGASAGLPGNLAAADKLVVPFTEREALAARAAWAKQLNIEPITTNKIGMKLALIPPGEFSMGSSSADMSAAVAADPEFTPRYHKSELPQHRVEITQPFLLGVYEVTQREWKDVMGSQPSVFSRSGVLKLSVIGQDTAEFPVDSVTWADATEFCTKLSQREGKTYRLPTEAEWEYACRAGTTTAFHFGDVLNGDKANCYGKQPYGTTTKGKDLNRTTRVGSYVANAFELYDMHGNVFEWCRDWYDDGYYSREATDDPENRNREERRVVRGGAWNRAPRQTRAAARYGVRPDFGGSDCGFRVVCVLR